MRWLVWTFVLLFASLQSIKDTNGLLAPVTGGLKTDRAALLALKNSVAQFGTSKMRVWKSSGNPCWPKAWPHVTCKLFQTRDGRYYSRVVGLDIANTSFVGSLPTIFGRLTAVQSINLEGNTLVGTIPSKWGSRLYFRSLRELVLRDNLLSGTLPDTWNVRRGWLRLRTLDLSKNRLVGGLPASWLGSRGTFRNLQELDLSENRLGLQSDGQTAFTKSEAADGWCRPGTGTESWCPPASSFTPRDSKMPNLASLDLSANQLQGALPSKWGYIFPDLQFLMLNNNLLFVGNTKDVAKPLPDTWTSWTVPQAFRNLEMMVMWPGNSYICNIPDPTRSGMRFLEVNGDAEFAMADLTREEFDSTGPWRCPGPAVHLAPVATDTPSDVISFVSGTNQIILKWKAPTPNPTSSIYGYKVFLSGADPDQGIIPGWWGKFFLTYKGAAPSGGLAEASGVYTLDTGVLADNGMANYPAGTYTMSVQTVYLDGMVSEPLSASGSTPVFPTINAQTVSLDTSGTTLTFGWNVEGGSLPAGSPSFEWIVSRWKLGGTKYTSVASGSGSETSPSLPESVDQDLTLSPASNNGDSFRIVVAGKAPLHKTSTSIWWAIVKYDGSNWSAALSTAGPMLAAPTLESATYDGSTNLMLSISLENDAPNRAVLGYKVTQGASAIVDATTTTTLGQLTRVPVDITSVATRPVTFNVELSVTANWFSDSQKATFVVTVDGAGAATVAPPP